MPTIHNFAGLKLGGHDRPYGFKASFNRTFRVDDNPANWWVTEYQFGVDQGPVVLMIENYRTGRIWDITRRCPYIVAGLRRAGFPAAGCSAAATGDSPSSFPPPEFRRTTARGQERGANGLGGGHRVIRCHSLSNGPRHATWAVDQHRNVQGIVRRTQQEPQRDVCQFDRGYLYGKHS